MQIAYNPDGGIKKITLPDSSSIDYAYNGPLLTAVQRKNPSGTTQYQHTYNTYDLSGNLLEASLINNLGELTSRYTLKGQPREQKTPYYSESLEYDPMNNIISKSYQDTLGKETNQYGYDALRQMKEESGYFNHQYTSDSLYNRSSKDGAKYTLNSLNCILSDGDANYTYDACGNVTSYNKNNKAYSFAYDALDRLTTLKIDDTTYAYTYDEQNRCITRDVTSGETISEKILFIGQCDIGTTDQNGQIKNLRVTGKGKGAEIGAAIALELKGEVFAPIHDHQGSIIALIDSNGKARESYRYSAFGEEAIFDDSGSQITDTEIDNPWRFSSKRKEADFNLFGRRFYNPDLGRWLTPDPAGHEAGPNLYAYVSNSPLSHFDQFGFLEEGERGFSFASIRDSLRDGWNACRDFLSRGFESANEGVSSLGRGISAVGNEIPIPGVRDAVRWVGHVMENRTLSGFEFSHTINRSFSEASKGDPHSSGKVASVLFNGVLTTKEEARQMRDDLSLLFAMCEVNLAYNGTIGALGDLLECAFNKLGLTSSAVNVAVETLRSAINKVGGVGSGGTVKADAHSQGGIILNLALTYLTAEEKAMICVTTYGSGTLIKPEGLRSCVNYVSERDLIPLIGDPIGYAAAKMGLRPDVIFLKPIEKGWLEHGFNCETYKMAREENWKSFQKKYCQ
jgi:RHS repeat-associated protein